MVGAHPVRALQAELLAQAARWPNQGFTSRIFVLHDRKVKDKIKNTQFKNNTLTFLSMKGHLI